ncbi:MAG: ATP-binding protein [Bacteroidota bacterium]
MNTFPVSNKDFFENYAEAVLITDKENTPLYGNPSFTKLTGFSADNLILFKTNSFLNPVENILERLQKAFRWETDLTKHDGTVLTVSSTVSKIILPDQSEGRVYTINSAHASPAQLLLKETETLLSEVKSELAETEKKMVKTNEEMDQLTYVVSHDMQEPLRMIVSYIQLMQKSIDQGKGEQVKEFMKFVTDGAERMQSLIADLLQLSRVNRKGDLFTKSDLNEIVSIALTHLASQIRTNGVDVTVDKLPIVNGDPSQIVRLFQNLLDNAIKFTDPERKPEILISVTDQKTDYLFSIKDNGIGIEKKYFDRIFVIFQRLHSRSEYEGTGVGLAVCKKIVERHGGTIWIDSEVGKGSTFYFTIKK